MKITKTTLAILSTLAFCSTSLQAYESNPHYVQEMNTMADNIEQRLAELRDIAKNPDYVTEKKGKKYLVLNEFEYQINDYGNVELPLMHWSDTSAIRNLFTFFDENWELSSFQGGAVFVNLKYGNYDYGKGCLLEYFPKDFFNTNHVLRETYSCKDTDQIINNDEAEYLNPFDFGLAAQSKNLLAIDKNEKYLALINASDNAAVGIRNIHTGENIRITGVKGNLYQSLSDVRFFAGKLYVAANKEGRIDVFNPENAAHLYSIKLTDFDSNAAKIAVNDQFVMVTSKNGIKAYLNSDSDADAFAQFNYTSLNIPHSLEIVDDKLIATSSESTVIYAIDAIAQNREVNAVITNLKGFDAIDINADQIIVKEKDRVAFYNLTSWINGNYQFKEATKALYLVDDFVIKSNDLLVEADHFYTINDFSIQRVHSPAVVSFDAAETVATTALKFAALPTSAVSPLFHDAMTEADFHALSANTSSLANVRLIDNKTVEIANFTEFNLRDLNLDLKALGQYDYARLSTMDELPAYTKIRLPLAYFNAELKFNAASGIGVYDYTKVLENLRASKFGGSLSLDNVFSSRFDTATTNQQIEKIKRITADWKISFRNHTFTSGMEKAWTPETAKQWLKLLTNMAYVISSEEFADRWMNFKTHYGYEMHNVPGFKGEFDQDTYASFLKSMQTNAFILKRTNQGFQTKTSIRGEVGSLFGMSDAEFERVLKGDLITFATYYGDQINRNYFLDCLPNPCDKDYDLFVNEEKGFAPMFVDVVETIQASGGLVY